MKNQLSEEERNELLELNELAEFRKWKEQQAIQKANEAIETSGTDKTPFHFQNENNQNFVIGHVEDVKNITDEKYLFVFELDKDEKLETDGIEFVDVEYEEIDDDSGKKIASGYINLYPNAKNYKNIVEILGGVLAVKGTISEIMKWEDKDDLTMGDLLAVQRGITETEKKMYREAAVAVFGLSEGLAERADDLTLILAIGEFLVNHKELVNEAKGLKASLKKLDILTRRAASQS
ncbi:hypothetical protein [Enterococcus avium]|uniref:hypothetical protein n=1 Tax=Enterococcus avium TaxID=33945 RepID=UPI001F5AA6C1|nr:hypothetical protein [Enterococcus avium]